jgi:ABC-type lipoprotein release transport system permease subunit
MGTLVFLLKRFAAQRLLGLAIVVTLAFTVGVLVAGPIYADAAREAIFTSAIRTSPVNVVNARFAVYGDPSFDAARADAEVRDATRRLPLSALVSQGRGTVRLAAARPGAQPLSITVLFRDNALEHLPYRGQAPLGPGQVALPKTIARALGVRRGDPVVVMGPTDASSTLTVAGTFDRPTSSDADYWYGAQSPFPPADQRAPGVLGVAGTLPPVIMDKDAYLATVPKLDVTTEYVWDAYIDYGGLSFAQGESLPGAIAQVDGELHADAALSSLRSTTGLPTLMELVRQRISRLRVPILLVVFQIGAVTLAVLAGVGALVLGRQSFELAVLRSRGFSAGKLIAGQGVQALLTAIVAYPLGLLFGMALALLASQSNGPSLPGVLFPIHLGTEAELLGLAGALVGALTLLLVSLPHVRRTILEERRLLSREDRPLLSRIPVEVVVLPLGVFAFVQVRNSGFVPSFERGALDPLVLLAPTLLIFGLSFLALRLLLFVLRRFDGRFGRARRLSTYLAARRLGRSPGTSFATSLLLVLSVGLLVVSTSYRAIVMRNHEDSAHQQVGADWRVQIGAPEQPLTELDRIPDNATAVIRSEPVFQVPGGFSITPVVLGVDPSTYGRGGWWRTDYSRTSEPDWLAALEVPPSGVPIGTGTVSAQVAADDDATGLDLVVTYQRADGRIVTADLGRLEPGTRTYEAPADGAERLLSLVLVDPGVGEAPSLVRLRLPTLSVGSRTVDLSDWQPLRWRGSGATITPEDGSVAIRTGAGNVLGGIVPPSPPIPAMVSPGVASSQGTEFGATMGGQLLEFREVAEADSFPTVAGDFLVASAPALLEAFARIPEPGLSLNEVWAMGADPRPALRADGFLVGQTASAGPIVAFLSQLPQSLAVGMHFTAAAGGLGLVVIGVAVGLYFAQRRREFEFASLRAMGTEAGQITRVLTLEQGVLIGFAVVAGVALGYGTIRLMMPYVGKSLGAAFPPPVMVLDWTSLGISVVAIGVAAAIGLAAAIRALLRSSVTSVLRGEAE